MVNECPSLAELQPLTRDEPSACSLEAWHPTESQRSGLATLHQLADVLARAGESMFAGFRPACHRALVIGTSGSGKTALVNRFAAERGVRLTAIDCGSFIITGAAAKPPTLRVIRDFVRSCPPSQGSQALEGIVFLDEICKLVPSEGLSQQSWTLGVAAEAIALLSADSRLAAHDWSATDIRRLRYNIMIVGGGAFQAALGEVRAAGNRGVPGFGSSPEIRATHSTQIAKYLPEEILSRFSSDIVVLDSPTREDFEQAIERIHSQLGVPRHTPLPTLVEQAAKGVGGMRWVENYLCRVLFEHPYAIRTRGKPQETTHAEAEPRSYDLMMADVLQCHRDANETATKLQTKLALIYSRLQSISNKGERIPQGGVFQDPHFGEALLGAIGCCRLTEPVTSSREAGKPLATWRAWAWRALVESSTDLEEHRLTELWSEAWSLAGALLDLRSKLAQAAQRGLLG